MVPGDIVTLSWFGATYNDPRKNKIGLVIKNNDSGPEAWCHVLWPGGCVDKVLSRYLYPCGEEENAPETNA